MSRIHDALKKAEEDKAGGGGPPEAPVPDVDLQRESAAVAPNPRPAFIGRSVPRSIEPLPESFLDHCAPQHWTQDINLAPQADARRRAIISEEFRTLRSRLYLMRRGTTPKKLLITSPLPKEGKTFVAANLARVMAKQADARVLLIDGDLRMCALAGALGAPPDPGLSGYLTGSAEYSTIIQRGPAGNFFFIPGGKAVTNSTELIGNGRFETLIHRLQPLFDWIIIDSPPAIPVSDARLLAGFCDGVMILVGAGSTPYELARKACSEFEREKVLGIILNRVEADGPYGYYYHYYYYGNNVDGHKRKGREG